MLHYYDFPTYYYWTKDDAGNSFNFKSTASLDIGMKVPNDAGTLCTIVDMDVEFPTVSVAELKFN